MLSMKELVAKAREVAERDDNYYEYIGIRFQDEEFALGSIDHCSHIWVDGDDTGEELDGICAIDYERANQVRGYYMGEHIAIIGSNDADYGEDAGELVMKDADVLEIVC